MESYQKFLDRINSFEKKEISFGDGDFTGNPSIDKKVDTDNSFRKFYGDTVVFDLDETVKQQLADIVDELYQAAPQCFCQRLVPHTFHMTLHDLSNSPVLSEVAEDMFHNELKIVKSKSNVQPYKNFKITMKSTAIFNMVNTSLVLGLCPTSEQYHSRLTELYTVIDKVKTLPYPLTPHITLAYYNVNGFDGKSAKALERVVNRLNKTDMEITLNVNDLYYQKFTSMNDYVDVINLAK